MQLEKQLILKLLFLVEDIVYSPNKYRETEGVKDNHANAILLLGFKDDDIFIMKELYVYNKDTSEIIKLAEGKVPKDVEMYCDSAEPDRIKMWRAAGYRAKKVKKEKTANKKYQATQIDWLKQRRIFIDPSCVNTIKEISQWKWKKDEATGEYIDEPVAFFDDAMAGLRYGTERWRKKKGKILVV